MGSNPTPSAGVSCRLPNDSDVVTHNSPTTKVPHMRREFEELGERILPSAITPTLPMALADQSSHVLVGPAVPGSDNAASPAGQTTAAMHIPVAVGPWVLDDGQGVASSAAVAPKTQLYNSGGWVVDGYAPVLPSDPVFPVSVSGVSRGTFGELKISHQNGTQYPQVWSLKPQSALRPALYGGAFGETHYVTPTLWTTEFGFIQDMNITQIDIHKNPANSNQLELKGSASNAILRTNNLVIDLAKPTASLLTAKVSFTLTAVQHITIDPNHQALHEGFQIARMASHYISSADQDSDYASYVNSSGNQVRVNLHDQNGFIFQNPTTLGANRIVLGHSTSSPRATPTGFIDVSNPGRKHITAQGYDTFTTDPNADNVNLAANWDGAAASYKANQLIGQFSFTVGAKPPG